jgi:hypothetical protein
VQTGGYLKKNVAGKSLSGAAMYRSAIDAYDRELAGSCVLTRMPMKVEGSCHCGQITFEAEIDPAAVRICHCTDCQTLTGSAYRVNVRTPAANFVLRSGIPKTYIKTAESGDKRAHAFCPNCGTPIYATDTHEPRAYGLRVGTLRQRAELRPTQQIWYRSALPWVTDIRDVAHVERQ